MDYLWYKAEHGKMTKREVRNYVGNQGKGLPEEFLPEDVLEFGIIPLIDTAEPPITAYQKVEDTGIVITDGVAVQTWKVVDRFDTQEELEAFQAQEVEDEATRQSDFAKAELINLDMKSIRSIREYLATIPESPQILKDFETQALLERAKVI